MKNKNIDWGKVLSSQEEFNKLTLNHIYKKKWYEPITYVFEFTIPDFFFDCKMKWQVLTRGYSDRNVWGMCDDLAELNIKLLTELRDHGNGHPSELTEKKWKAILTKMIQGFEAHLEGDWMRSKKNEKKFEEGMALYVKYYANLWN